MISNRMSKIFVVLFVLVTITSMLAACAAPTAAPNVAPTTAPASEEEPAAAPTNTEPAQEEPQPSATPVPEEQTQAETQVPVEEGVKGVLVVKEGNVQQWERNFNPFIQQPPALWASTAAMYEPMMIYNQATSEFVPWLATEYAWNDNGTQLTFTIREGVNWSDGEPFSANDVAFTFNMLKQFPALDTGGVWQNLESVEAPDDTSVVFTFVDTYIPGLLNISQVQIVPEHIWGELEDPTTFTNENPVATGPFTEVTEFKDQVYQVDRNPNYWQEGKPFFQAIRVPVLAEDAYFLSLPNGEFDWGSSFIPDVQTIYADKDPENFKWWAPGIGNSTFLYLNTTREPFDDVRVRKAFSMALDRDLMIETALYGYSDPDDSTGLSASLSGYKDPTFVEANKELVTLNIDEANRLLDEAGLTKGPNGMRRLPDGSPWKVYLDNAGWADYAAISQIAAQNLKAVGVDAEARAFNPDAWFDKVFKGDFDAAVGWSASGSTPYETYRGLMASATVKPIGETSGENWQRFSSEKADELLADLATTTDLERQKEISYELAQVFADEFPAIPLYSQGVLTTYNLARFGGFPSESDPYVAPATYNIPQTLIVLTTIKPK